MLNSLLKTLNASNTKDNEYVERVSSRLKLLSKKNNSFINYPLTLKIPIQKANVVLHIKEDRKLDALSFYILDSVKRFNADIVIISKTTNLSESLITSEIQRLKKQDLLRDKNGKTELSETGYTLWYANYLSIISKSREKKKHQSLILNLIDKSIISDTKLILSEDETATKLFAKYNLENISIDDDCINKFLVDNIEETTDEITSVIDFLYIELESDGTLMYIDKPVLKLPCYCQDKRKNDNSESLLAKGIINAITFSYESKKYTVYFDTVSGNVFFEPPSSGKKYAN